MVPVIVKAFGAKIWIPLPSEGARQMKIINRRHRHPLTRVWTINDK
jgi:hypothetical protein